MMVFFGPVETVVSCWCLYFLRCWCICWDGGGCDVGSAGATNVGSTRVSVVGSTVSIVRRGNNQCGIAGGDVSVTTVGSVAIIGDVIDVYCVAVSCGASGAVHIV